VIIDTIPSRRRGPRRTGLTFLAVCALLVPGLAWLGLSAQQASRAGREADIHRRWIVCQFVRDGVNPYPFALAALERVHGRLGGRADKPRVYAIPRPTRAEETVPLVAAHGLPEAVYPPSADVLLSWSIGRLPQGSVHLAWLLINLGLLAGLVYLVCSRELAVPARTPLAIAVVTALLLAWSPIQATVHTGQFSILVTVCVLLAARWLDDHEIAAGAALSLALIKPSMALPFLVLPLIRQRWRALGVVAASHLAATCLQSARFGCPPWELMRQWLGVAAYFAQGQFTLQEVLAALHLADTRMGAVLVVAFALFVTAWCWANRAAPDVLLVDLLCFVSVLWTYHGPYDFAILFVPLVRRMSAAVLPGRRVIPFLALASFLCLSLAISPLVYSDEAHVASRLVRHAARLLLALWLAGLMLQVARAGLMSPRWRFGLVELPDWRFGLARCSPPAASVATAPRRAAARSSLPQSKRAPSTVRPAPPA
jgi:hypothetical protein